MVYGEQYQLEKMENLELKNVALDVGLGRVIAWNEEWESWGVVVGKWDVWQGRREGELG